MFSNSHGQQAQAARQEAYNNVMDGKITEGLAGFKKEMQYYSSISNGSSLDIAFAHYVRDFYLIFSAAREQFNSNKFQENDISEFKDICSMYVGILEQTKQDSCSFLFFPRDGINTWLQEATIFSQSLNLEHAVSHAMQPR